MGTTFFPILLVLSCVAWLAVALEISQKETHAPSSRAQSSTDTWNTLLEIPTGAAPRTSLFKECISAPPVRKVIPSQLEVEGVTFLRYEINGLEVGNRAVVWNQTINATYIVDCAEAAKAYRMFQFDGSTCKMSSESYIYTTKAYCYSLKADSNPVVYINTALSPPECPANTEKIATFNRSAICLGVHQSLNDVGIHEASQMCVAKYNGVLYMEMPYFNFTKLQSYLKSKSYTGNYLVQATNVCGQGFLWGGSTVAAKVPVNKDYIDQTTFANKYKVERLYLRATGTYKLVARGAMQNFRIDGSNGFICMTLA